MEREQGAADAVSCLPTEHAPMALYHAPCMIQTKPARVRINIMHDSVMRMCASTLALACHVEPGLPELWRISRVRGTFRPMTLCPASFSHDPFA